jgi:small-conductance mechanosensitive channel
MDANSVIVNDAIRLLKLDTVLLTLLAFGFLYGLAAALRVAAEGLVKTFPNVRLSVYQVLTVLTFVVYTVGVLLIVLLIIRPPQGLLLALTGSAAVAIGFAFKDLATSIVAGLIVLFDRPFRVGDRVSFQDYYGDIVAIGLRSVRLNTLSDDLVTIPNNLFLTEAVASGNAGALDMQVSCRFHVSLEADLESVRELVREIVVTSRFTYLEKPVTILVEEVEVARQLAYRITGKAYVIDVHYQKAFETDLTVRAARAFKERGIPRPRSGSVS